ncbi:oxidoreductase [Alsobacter metallidurans]|uniref:Oxidoreductase n=1 Tax=Alsobacter metallidurans TaxID=340221 RepID=A0A917I826_9HYPH|nr:NAD(P)-binding domain-containing protein [Alsobacter metallidurans]GGH24171.1 oxidoreductase [Alsobacter metallidurans]
MNPTATVAFVGLGVMGLPMAANLARGGFRVLGHDLAPGAQAAARSRQVGWSDTLPAAAEAADVVITMLPNGAAAHDVAEVLTQHMRPDALYIDMSTIAPDDTDKLNLRFTERGIRMVDAPVARSSKEAEEGRLLIMAGGRDEDIDRARPLFSLLADTVMHCGPVGSGSRMKLVNNYMSLTINVVTAEALAMAQRSGLQLDTVYGVLSQTVAGKGHLTTTYPAKAFKGDLEPGFMIDLARKDIGLILAMAESAGVPAATARAALTVYDTASRNGRGRQDHTAVYEMCLKGGPWS